MIEGSTLNFVKKVASLMVELASILTTSMVSLSTALTTLQPTVGVREVIVDSGWLVEVTALIT